MDIARKLLDHKFAINASVSNSCSTLTNMMLIGKKSGSKCKYTLRNLDNPEEFTAVGSSMMMTL